MVTHLLNGMLAAGALDDSVCTAGCDCEAYLYGVNATSAAHVALARSIAAEAIILLKNDHDALPIPMSATVAVVGSACDASHEIDAEGDWKAGDYYVVGGSGRVVGGYAVSILGGLVASGVATVVSATDHVADAIAVAAGADYVLVCAAGTTTEDDDRATLRLDQHELLVGLSAASTDGTLGGAHLVVAAMAPGAIAVSPWSEHAHAILLMFLGGQETGNGWADVLLGRVTPAGKLPVTLVRDDDDAQPPGPCVGTGTSSDVASLHCVYTERLQVGWRGMHGQAVGFPFGHGLSYTSFTYAWGETGGLHGPVALDEPTAAVVMSVVVTNAGAVAGAEIVQLYVRYPPSAGEPPSGVLRAFKKTRVLQPGESQTVAFTLAERAVSVWSESSSMWTRVAGQFTMAVGSSSRDIRLDGQVLLV